MKYWGWIVWVFLTLGMSAYLFVSLQSEDKSVFLVGISSDGHHQIETSCATCHTSPFGGTEILQTACEGCHLEELRTVRDSHPQRKFTDPANADRVAILDARYCVTCHREHQEDITGNMGLTVPEDVCQLCHENIGEERATHTGLAFDSCTSSGCHNFHDNTALYEDFLLTNSGKPWLNANRVVPSLTAVETALQELGSATVSLQISQAHAPDAAKLDSSILKSWSESAHALTNTNCSDCHGEPDQWVPQPALAACQNCHTNEATGFLAGKHGMRQSVNLSAMTPLQARSPMHKSADHIELSCSSCHDAHSSDLTFAAVDACQSCHSSEHTTAYSGSPHDQVRLSALAGNLPKDAAVTCATCHMPRSSSTKGGTQITHVEHNQNANLRPNDKMLRSVCMNCHSLEFSIDALADTELVNNNFRGNPALHVESIDMVLKRRQAANESTN